MKLYLITQKLGAPSKRIYFRYVVGVQQVKKIPKDLELPVPSGVAAIVVAIEPQPESEDLLRYTLRAGCPDRPDVWLFTDFKWLKAHGDKVVPVKKEYLIRCIAWNYGDTYEKILKGAL